MVNIICYENHTMHYGMVHTYGMGCKKAARTTVVSTSAVKCVLTQ